MIILRESYSRSFALAVPPKSKTLTHGDLGYTEDFDMFSFDLGSSIFKSALAGAFSITAAQFNHYSVVNETNMNLKGTLVYLLACVCNTVAVMSVQAVYFCFAFPYFYTAMLVFLELANGIPPGIEEGPFPDLRRVNKVIMYGCIIVWVILPITVIPRLFEKALEKWMEKRRGGNDDKTKKGEDKKSQLGLSFFPNRDCCDLSDHFAMKTLLHCFYVFVTLVMVHTIHLPVGGSRIMEMHQHLSILTYAPAFNGLLVMAFASFPVLGLSMAALWFYNSRCHIWNSEDESLKSLPQILQGATVVSMFGMFRD